MTSPAQAGAPSPEKQALIEAFDEVIRADVERRGQPSGRRSKRRWPIHPVAVACLVIWAVTGAYLISTRPSWLFDRGMPTESPAIQEASLRLAMAMKAEQIERFRQRQGGRLPATIDEVGPVIRGISYERVGNDFVLRGVNGSASLMLKSTDPIRAFVGNSYVVIQGRGQR
jgi:hypothetical protein